MDKFEEACEWVKYSDNDLTAVNQLITHHPIQIEIVCYLCQQSAEKALKSFWVFQGVRPPKTHDLSLLLTECMKHDTEFNNLVNECIRLNIYASQPRYPFGLSLIDTDMRKAIEDCTKISEFTKTMIYPRTSESDCEDLCNVE